MREFCEFVTSLCKQAGHIDLWVAVRNLGEIFVHLCHFSIIPTWSGLKFRINIIVSFSALIFALIIITFPNEHDNKYDNRFNFKTHLDVQKALHTNIDG